jgi:hypothetical protein
MDTGWREAVECQPSRVLRPDYVWKPDPEKKAKEFGVRNWVCPGDRVWL